jgi:hypothetical protein
LKETGIATDRPAHDGEVAADGLGVSSIVDDVTGADAHAPSAPEATPRSPIVWGEVVRWALMGTLLLVLLVLVDVNRNGGNNPVSLIQPGTDGSASELFTQDFPDLEQPDADGLDGQIYYAIARDPIHLDETSQYLDHPRYRFQRPLLPVAAWLLHPTGGGLPLVGALVLVSLAGIVIAAVAAGGLSMALRGPAWMAAVIPLLPGAYWSLRVTVSDTLALGLALAAILLAVRGRSGWAVLVGCLAVLAKEPAILLLLGWSISRRTKRDALLTVVPAVVIVAWMGWLALQLPPDLPRSQDIGPPVAGLVQAWTDVWSGGDELIGMASTVTGLVIGVAALAVRRLRHPLGWMILVQLGFMAVMGMNPLGTNFGGTRMAMPLVVVSLLALVTPRAAEALAPAPATAPDSALA